MHALLAGAAVLMLVYIALSSLRLMAITLINLPFSLAGGIVAVWITGSTLSIGSMVGFITLFGIALVPIFMSFGSIYSAHGAFTAAVTPPLVVALFLGVFWRRFTPTAALWTMGAGSFRPPPSVMAQAHWSRNSPTLSRLI